MTFKQFKFVATGLARVLSDIGPGFGADETGLMDPEEFTSYMVTMFLGMNQQTDFDPTRVPEGEEEGFDGYCHRFYKHHKLSKLPLAI